MYKKIDLNKLIIYDIETLHNAIVICCLDYATKKRKEFIFYNDKKYENQPIEFFKFLRTCVRTGYTFLGFNVLGFDSQILHYYYTACQEYENELFDYPIYDIIGQLYHKAQDLINSQESQDRFNNDFVSENKLFAPHIDVFKQLHYDRKRISLKWVEFSMRYPKIQEMPISHEDDIELAQVDEVVDYCWNDVLATEQMFTEVKFETDVRLDLSKEFDLNLINASEPKMVREIFGKFLCQEMQIPYSELRQMKTLRGRIPFNEIIFPYVNFQSEFFKDVFQVVKNAVVDATIGLKPKFEHKFKFQDMEVVLGLGGIHACVDPGVYTHTEDEVIEDADGTSFYPFLAIQNNLRPEHLGEAYNVVYPMMYEKRKQYDKKDPRNYIFKIVLNSAYGLSKEPNTYLYDPKYTYSVTINGQLSLLMLVEALYMSVPDIKFIQMNTDGITYKYNTKHEAIVRKICKWWEKTTKINLDYAYYDRMIINDVNNYIAVKEGYYQKLAQLTDEKEIKEHTKSYVKKKGLFDTDLPFHKNPSALIIPKALEQFFINNLTPEDFIRNEKNSIFDFCLGVKKTRDFKLHLIQNFNYAELIKEQQRVCRHIVCTKNNESGLLVKDFNDGRRISVIANQQVQPLDEIYVEDVTKYDVDYRWYIKETNKIIEAIKPSIIQETLF